MIMVLSWVATGLTVPWLVFTLSYPRWRRAVKGSLPHAEAAILCRISVFPGWPCAPLQMVRIPLLFAQSSQDGSGLTLTALLLAMYVPILLLYTRDARRFLAEDDWWNNQRKKVTKRIKKMINALAPAPRPALGWTPRVTDKNVAQEA